MNRSTRLLRNLALVGSFAASLVACQHGALQPKPTSASYGGAAEGYGSDGAAGDDSGASERSAPAPSAVSRSHGDVRAEAPSERPGLGTVFGENRYSPVRDAPFDREGGGPTFVASLHYNDATGASAHRDLLTHRYQPGEPMFRILRGTGARAQLAPLWGGVVVRVVDGSGTPLPAYHIGDRVLLIGEAGGRYAIEIENRTNQRYEVVTSVDGLDVIDGRPANLNKRGYLVDAFARIRIDGYRRSMNDVAAFRFGSVRDSYAQQTAEFGARNVGVIGVALFSERGAALPTYDAPDLDDEARRREAADPFPGRFAPPPPAPRPYY